MGQAEYDCSALSTGRWIGGQYEPQREEASHAGGERRALETATVTPGAPSHGVGVEGRANRSSTSLSEATAPGSRGESQSISDVSVASWQERLEECLTTARSLFARSPHWLDFFREVFGAEGVVTRLFPDPKSLSDFNRTAVCREIQQMLEYLRTCRTFNDHLDEPLRMITVRLPSSVYTFIQNQAKAHGMSMNRYCVGQLLRVAEEADRLPAGLKRQVATRAKPK